MLISITELLRFPKRPYNLAGFEPESSVLQADVMTTTTEQVIFLFVMNDPFTGFLIHRERFLVKQKQQCCISCPGGVAQWTLHQPQEQKTWVRIPKGYM
jgi:hypothetical protein